jgi:hypothetical protein
LELFSHLINHLLAQQAEGVIQVVCCTSLPTIRILQYATGAKKRRLLRKDLVCSRKNGDFSEVSEIVIMATTRSTDCSSDRCARIEGGKNMVDAVANVFDTLLRRIEKFREDTGLLRDFTI